MTNQLYTITMDSAPTVSSETVIDGWLEPDEIEILYKRWKPSWPAPLEFPGAVTGITCEGVLQVSQSQLNRTYGKIRGEKFMKIAKENNNA